MRVFYSDDYVRSEYHFDTTRKAKWIANSLVDDPIHGVNVEAPCPLTYEDVVRVHSAEYADAVRCGTPDHLSESQGFRWDSGVWNMALAVNGGILSASRAALEDGVSGSLSSGQHHAKRDYGAGYCTFNGLAIAAKTLVTDGTVKSVLVLDTDAHCGGGTARLIDGARGIAQLDLSVSQYDRYYRIKNAKLHLLHDSAMYLSTLSEMLSTFTYAVDLVIYNAGMDPHERCDVGGLSGVTDDVIRERERTVFRWCSERGFPVAFALAGGYTGALLNKKTLTELHRVTVSEAAKVQ